MPKRANFDQLRARSASVNVIPSGTDPGGVGGEHILPRDTAVATSLPMPGGLMEGRPFFCWDRTGKWTADVPAEPRWELSFVVPALFALGGVTCNRFPKGSTEQRR